MKKIVKIVIFLFIFFLLFFLVFKILWLPKNSIAYFYKEPKNSLDIVYIGGSSVYAHFNTTLAYEEYGFTTGLMSSDSQYTIAVKYLIEESRKYQNPKLFVVDLVKLADSFSEISDAAIRKTADSLKFSKNRKELVDEFLKYADVPKEEYINYYYSFFKYHDIWKDLGQVQTNIFGNKTLYKGYVYSDYTSQIEAQDECLWTNEVESLPVENKKVLEDLLKYIKEKQIEVLFIIPKRFIEYDKIKMLNDGISMIKESGYNVINFNILDDFKVDFNHDFYNSSHLNVYGATKYTLYFSKYLSEHYDLEDHRKDEKYSSWDKEYERFKSDFKKVTNENFDELLHEYKSNAG